MRAALKVEISVKNTGRNFYISITNITLVLSMQYINKMETRYYYILKKSSPIFIVYYPLNEKGQGFLDHITIYP